MTKGIEVPGMLLPEIDDVTRREFLIGAAGLPSLPEECGDSAEEPGGASGEGRTAEPSSAWTGETGPGSAVGVKRKIGGRRP